MEAPVIYGFGILYHPPPPLFFSSGHFLDFRLEDTRKGKVAPHTSIAQRPRNSTYWLGPKSWKEKPLR